MTQELKELDLLKEFFSSRVESLKLRLHDVLSTQEDLQAKQQSSESVKEHLLQRNRTLDNELVQLQTQYLHKSQKLSGLELEAKEARQDLTRVRGESREEALKAQAQVRAYKEKNKILIRQNRVFRDAF